MFTVFYLGEKKSQITLELQPFNESDNMEFVELKPIHAFCCPVGPKGKKGVKGVPYTDEENALMIWANATRQEGGEQQYLN